MGPTKNGCMTFAAFSEIYYWQSLNDRDWYDKDEYFRDCTYGLKRVFNEGTKDVFTVEMQRSGNDGVWKWEAWKGEDATWYDHHVRCGYKDELMHDAPGFLFESMAECYDALIDAGWMAEV